MQKGSLTKWCVIFLFYLVLTQDLFASIFFKAGIPNDIIKGFLFLKETIVILVGISILVQSKVSRMRFYLILFTSYASIFLFVSKLPLYYILLGYRTYLLLLFSFLIGESLVNAPAFDKSFYKHIKIIFTLILLFSFTEYFILPSSIWVHVFPVIEMKRAVLGLTIDEFNNTGLPINAFGELTRRMIGPFNDPLTLSYFSIIIFNFFLVQFLFNGKSKSRTALGGVLILLSQTRAIILGLSFSIIGFIFKSRSVKKKYIIFGLGVFVIGFATVIIFSDWFLAFGSSIFTKEGRNTGHFTAYVEGIKLLLAHPLGSGIGASSVIVNFSGIADTSLGTENAFINVALEIGLLGAAWLVALMVNLIHKFKVYLSQNKVWTQDYLVVASGYLLLIEYLFAGIVAPHILIARILIPFMIIIGWAYSVTTRTQE